MTVTKTKTMSCIKCYKTTKHVLVKHRQFWAYRCPRCGYERYIEEHLYNGEIAPPNYNKGKDMADRKDLPIRMGLMRKSYEVKA